MSTCEHCREPIPEGRRSDARYCRPACREAAFRVRRKIELAWLRELRARVAKLTV